MQSIALNLFQGLLFFVFSGSLSGSVFVIEQQMLKQVQHDGLTK
jgi:hypothetical protein